MKPQDLLFILVLTALIYKRNAPWAAYFGLGAIVIAIPLFYFQVFFTAQRFILYAAAFLLLGFLFQVFQMKKHDRIKK